MSRPLSSVNPSSCPGRYEGGEDGEGGEDDEDVSADEVEDARDALSRLGAARSYCRLDDATGRRCWLLPGHRGACCGAEQVATRSANG